MNESIVDLDLAMAWRRVKWDLSHRTFVSFAFLKELLDLGIDEWLVQLGSAIQEGRYSPKPCEICDVPKKGFHLRPGARLDLEDHVVYAGLVQEMYPSVRDYLQRGKAHKDFAYLLRGAGDVPWFQQPPFHSWKGFQVSSLKKIDDGAQVVLFADISGFYENIDLQRLQHTLRSVSIPEPPLELLFRCLRLWAEPRGRGIPQGLSPSDLLAKVYLDPLDRLMERDGFDHSRYVDDFRVFCQTRPEGKKALRRLTILLRNLGLNLEASKTEILSVEDARARIAGKIPEIEQIRSRLLEVVRAEGFDNPYLNSTSFADLEAAQADVARDVLETAFRENFLEPEDESFDSSLFHYLLTRLGPLQSDIAVDFSISQLTIRPEETIYILEYLSRFASSGEVPGRIVAYAQSEDAIYDYQLHLILGWLLENRVQTEESLQLARGLMANRGHPLWLRSVAMALVGEFGDAADLESIEALYTSAANDLERAIILCSIRRMTRMRRNGAYGRYGGDNLLNSLAVRWARQRT